MIKKILNLLQNKNKIYLNKSLIHGTGIFAGKPYKKGEVVVILEGKKITKKYRGPIDDKEFANWFEISQDVWVDPKIPLSHINHSCEPNLGMTDSITFVALRDIAKGEELTFDYSICDSEVEWVVPCLCKSLNCRKQIRSIQFLPKETYNKYMPYIPLYFQKKYKEYNGD